MRNRSETQPGGDAVTDTMIAGCSVSARAHRGGNMTYKKQHNVFLLTIFHVTGCSSLNVKCLLLKLMILKYRKYYFLKNQKYSQYLL